MDVQAEAVSTARLEREIFTQIPLAAAMRIRVADYRADRLVLTAPFAINRNHQNSAFGGSIEAMATLAGWGLVWLMLADPGAEIVIHRSETRFREAIVEELRAAAVAPPQAHRERFRSRLARHGRASIEIIVHVGNEKKPGAEFLGCYGVIRPPKHSSG